MIGTITLHHNANYGANLQAYALVKCLSTITNQDVQLIDYRNERIRNLYRISPFNRTDNGIRINITSCKRFAKILLDLKGTAIRDKKFYKFRKKYIPMTKTVKNNSEILNLGCSHLFIGSDQIWNDWITGDQKNRVFYGNVKADNIVASYAPSLGNSTFSLEEDAAVSTHINKFDFLSVREGSLIDLINGRYHGNITTVCDPAFLLTKSEWKKMCAPKAQGPGYIFVYFLERNPVLFDLIQKAANHFGLEVKIFCDGRKLPPNVGTYDRTADPIDFITGIKNAEFIVTNSFHGTVFSLLFNKKFVTVPDTKRGTRMIELLKRYSLDDHIWYQSQDFDANILKSEIDYQTINSMIAEERSHAIEFLTKVLEATP